MLLLELIPCKEFSKVEERLEKCRKLAPLILREVAYEYPYSPSSSPPKMCGPWKWFLRDGFSLSRSSDEML